jgi:two-component system, OmpR family, sensor histidine kinase KdpD
MARGTLRIYLGAAPGVGKTFAMLNEAWRRASRGTDVVVGFVETHGRPNTAAQIRDLEVVPRKKVVYRGAEFEEMDVDAILERNPAQVLVDELAHTNVPGSRHEKRWQDVEDLLAAGIDVISTVNVQHLESMNDVVEQITGIKQRETIPDAVVRSADQIEIVDMTPQALRRRMAHGNIYPPEKVDASLANYFREGNLGALRELALMWVADRVDEALEAYREAHGIARPWETRERVLVAITGAPGGDDVIRRAARMAARTRGELLGVHVRSADGLRGPPGDALTAQRMLLQELGGEYHELASADAATALVQFARAENATQIVLGASRQSRWTHLVRGSVINDVIRASGSIDIHVISSEGDDEARPDAEPEVATDWVTPEAAARRPRALAVSRRRRLLAWALAVVAPPLLTLVLANVRDTLTLPSDLLMFLLVVVVVAALGGFVPAFVCAVTGFLLANWFFTPPFYELTIAQGENLVALVIFLLVGGVVSLLVATASRRTVEAAQARAEAETLAALSGTIAASDDPLPQLVGQLRAAFEADGVAVLGSTSAEGEDLEGWRVLASAGDSIPGGPDDSDVVVPLHGTELLVLRGEHLGDDDREVLRAFAGQVALAVQQRELKADADRAVGLAEANELRTALLAAVSHDLRTPLSSIKASVSSLLQRDVDFTPGATRELLETIDEGADRLNHLIGNLLDMSRLQTGAVQLVMRDVGLDEVVPAALAGLTHAERVTVDVAETLPRVRADAALLERAIANVVENAIAWSPPDASVRVEACVAQDRVDLHVVDRGPGIPPAQREDVFRPFQRLGDRSNGSGVGLGLAVARGFVEAMGGEVVVDDTPGGGVTMVISLPVSPA